MRGVTILEALGVAAALILGAIVLLIIVIFGIMWIVDGHDPDLSE